MDKKNNSSCGIYKIMITILLVLLIASVSFQLYYHYVYNEKKQAFSNYLSLEKGYELGLILVVANLLDQLEGCETTTISFGNVTKSVIDANCR